MDFEWSKDQRDLYDAAVAFAQKELDQDVLERDRAHDFSRVLWDHCAKFGVQGLLVPTEYGGAGSDPLTTALVLEALGYGCSDNGLLFSVGAHLWSAVVPVLRFGSPEQQQRWLPGLADGSLIGVGCMTEPGTGSDAFSLTTSARQDGDTYVLRGAKTYITNAPVADLLLVFASTAPGSGVAGLCSFLVPRDTPGLSVGRPFHKMGLRTSPMSEVVLDDCVVPAGNLLGSVGSGMAIFNTSMDWERSLILATAVGTMQRHLDRATAYAKSHRQFGQPIGKFQAVSHRIVDMRVRLEAARLLLYSVAWKKTKGRNTAAEAAMVKLFLSEAFVQSSLDLLHVHGALGYMEEAEIERDVRDALASRIYSGTSDIQRNLVAGRMGL